MRAGGRWVAAAAIGIAASPGLAWSAPVAEGVRIDQMQPASPQSPFFRAEGPHEAQDEGVEYAVGLTFDYAKGPLKAADIDTQGNTSELPSPVEHALLAHIGGSLTPAHWVEIDLSMPIALFESGSVDEGSPLRVRRETIAAPKAPGIGDLRVGLHFRPLDDKTFGLIIGGRFWAPFGSEEAYLSDQQLRAEVDLGFAGDVSPVLYGCTFSIAPGLFLERNGDRGSASCALHVKPAEMFSIGVESTVSVINDLDYQDERSFQLLVEPMGAARVSFDGFRVGVGAGPGFGGAPGTAEVRGLLSVAYIGGGKAPSSEEVKGTLDSDLDKIPDSLDACPDQAGPDSKDASTRGCPALDRDADGIRDDEDWCPDRAGIANPDPKANGCPDVDNDDLPDPIDTCPNEPGAPPSGCPTHARLVRDSFKVDPPITFSKAELSADGQAALEEIAATIRANPKIEVLSVALGTKGDAPELADERARKIILVFRAGFLDTNRYEVVLRDDLPAGVVQFRVVR